ncbi:PPOX class F420-dependent oxidoreductase [Mycobacteroides chelonae]|uniref:TIGR03668 family PPOX class F420-dependent oxidoreductase n=2 Tax=Mycobacteroides chelonae TaxID=1774 RepID=UPI0007A0E834|nr:TIGR03668 family PPOX class F420-dependent oxidoreductase [Mycobacteroides chelonae]AMW21043.1 putative coenzyme F420-dependent enzyme [Mycobacterium sp. QIA-37]PKQ56903.1 PPOX class F420-dependent oxidoreductase [Mycobacterium sp. MHSD3]SKN56311.1 pyridoxamine 5'-phosphate oxidase-like protein [Mycobacteroides abscessus subsp. bolletii]MBF9522594.1 TIGR03668 family PPOX class F420-dependent oxidoreductase [Mycobacteroides chelonae]OHU60605.1 PPOX class F420-dependent oxidoreductase [Mycoba
MRLDPADARSRFRTATVARLATVHASTVPHLVPVTFVVADDVICWAVDHKPKSRNDLQRLRNIAANPAVSFLVDHYDEDWSALWWARADGIARTLDEPDPAWISLLANKYRQYRENPPAGPMVLTDVSRWSGWTASPVQA